MGSNSDDLDSAPDKSIGSSPKRRGSYAPDQRDLIDGISERSGSDNSDSDTDNDMKKIAIEYKLVVRDTG